jgi:hypothetical protein
MAQEGVNTLKSKHIASYAAQITMAFFLVCASLILRRQTHDFGQFLQL